MRAESQKSLDLLRKMLTNPTQVDSLRKAWTQPSSSTQGLQQYNLEAPSKKLFPRITPLRNEITRYKVTGGNAINWRAVTGINTGATSPVVSEGNRNAFLTTTTANYTRAFAGLGHEDYVTFEAGYAGEGFEDIRALAMENTMSALMISEEFFILGGNATLALGVPATPTTTGSGNSGGNIASGTYNVAVVALTLEGLRMAGTAGPVVTTVSRTNADGSVDTIAGGSSNKSSTGSTGALTGPNAKIVAQVTAVRGAAGYAWYVGTAGNEKLEAITTTNTVTLTSLLGTGQALTAITADNSRNTLGFDGIITLVSDSAGGGYWKSLDGAFLTANSDGSIKEIDAALQDRWNNYRLTIQEIWVNAQELLNITNKVTAGGTATAFRITIPQGDAQVAGISAGSIVAEYISKFNMEGARSIPIRLHPNVPAGTIIGLSKTLPYPVSNVPSVFRMAVRQEYYGQDWPLQSRKYTHGVYVDEVLQCYAPFACIVISNIGNG